MQPYDKYNWRMTRIMDRIIRPAMKEERMVGKRKSQWLGEHWEKRREICVVLQCWSWHSWWMFATKSFLTTFINCYSSLVGSYSNSLESLGLNFWKSWQVLPTLLTMLLPSTLTLTPLVHSGTRFLVRWQSHVQYHSDYRKCEHYPSGKPKVA